MRSWLFFSPFNKPCPTDTNATKPKITNSTLLVKISGHEAVFNGIGEVETIITESVYSVFES
jgi:hypothetical protein